MRHSMSKIFTNLNIYLVIVLFISVLATLLVYEKQLSFDKVNTLKEQKEIVSQLTKLNKENINLSLIEFNSKSRRLHSDIEVLRHSYTYNFTGKFLVGNEQEYMLDLDRLSTLTTSFNNAAKDYYAEDTQDEAEKLNSLNNSLVSMNSFIDAMIYKNISYNEETHGILNKLSIISTFFILVSTIWYRRRLLAIDKDIKFLYTIEKDKNKNSYQIFSQEVDAIALRMKRKTVTLDNPEMLDPVTDIYNYKGLQSAYSNKRNAHDGNFITVAILEIDSFSKSNRAFSQEATQAMLKKTAFTISLHEQPTDIVARTDYNQFTVILSRTTKKQSYLDLDVIRQSIAEIKFNTPTKGPVNISISGGCIVKATSVTLDDAIIKAKEVLGHAKSRGGNRISQTQDLIVIEDKNIPLV